jgi:alkane 1-monooxygenase
LFRFSYEAMMRALPFALSLTFVPIAVMAVTYGGVWTVAGAIYGLMLIPIADYFVGLKTSNASEESGNALFRFRVITWVWVPIQLGIIFSLIAAAGTDRLSENELLAAAVSTGLMTGGIGITYAHEMMHQTNRFERALAEILMTSTLYGHFCIEHIAGHHVNVATLKDPVTARFGEPFYWFFPRAIFGSLFSAWGTERLRLQRSERSIWHLSNAFWRYSIAYAVFLAVAYALAGWLGIKLFVLQAFVAILLLENINYVEHYGLMRRPLGLGRYEPVRSHHSWNASHRLTNYFLINLQRHSDHHKNPMRRFPFLQHYDEKQAPQLPFGYPAMLLIALVPPLWFRLMNPKVLDWHERFWERDLRSPSSCPSPARGEGTTLNSPSPAPSPLVEEGWGEGGRIETGLAAPSNITLEAKGTD